MPIQRTTPAAITHNLNTTFGSSSTAARQTNEVTSTTSSNVTDIIAMWALDMPSVDATATTRVDVYVWGTNDDSGYPGTNNASNENITGTNGNITLSANNLVALRFLKSTNCVVESSAHTARDEASIVAALGYIPRRWGLVFVNQTGANLGTTNNAVEYVETFYN